MKLFPSMSRLTLAAATLLLASAVAPAADKTLMHCFAFTPQASATPADWEAFYKATAALPTTMKGVVAKTWAGKLKNPLSQITLQDPEARKKLMAGEKDVPAAKINLVRREYGACFHLVNEAALKAYAEHPEHKKWEEVYSKVRVPGTTTFDIIEQ
jgi:hypothetical protein